MSTNGQLVFTDVDKITFKGVGNASNAVIDTLTGKIGVGVDSPDANLHVVGNSYVSTNLELGGTLIMGTVNVEAQHSLEAVTATGNTTPLTIEFTNPTTSLVASGNVEVGGDVVLSGNIYNNANLSVQYTTIFPTWTQVGQDIDGEAAGDSSGWSVSMSSDGTRMAIGAIRNDGTASEAGHVRVYEWNSGTSLWTQVGQDIDGEAAGDNDWSGFSVSISSDGTRVAIGAVRNDGTAGDAGHVRVYSESGGTWTQVGSDIDGEAASDQSGYSVSISSDGTRVAIGAYGNDGNGSDAGHVRVYEESGGTWTQVGSDIDGEAAGDMLGTSVSMSSDGARVAIGADSNDDNGSSAGHVRVYAESSGTWTQVGNDIDGEAAGDESGWSVSMSSDGTRVAIGARGNDGTGHVRVYSESGGTWTQVGSDIDGEAAGDQSGAFVPVSMSSDGTRVAIGAPRNDGTGTDAGHVRVYDWAGRSKKILKENIVEVSGELIVSGNATVSSNLTVSGNATVSSNLTVSGNVVVDTNTLFVDSVNNRVGVGTSTPGRFLEVYTGNGTVPGIRLRRGAGSAYTDLHHVGVNVPSSGDLEGLAIITSDGNATTQEVIRICGNGRVGIGTTSPSTDLQIGNTTDKTSDTYLTIASDGGSAYAQGIKLIHHHSNYGWRIRGDDTDDCFHINYISAGSNNASALIISNTGQILAPFNLKMGSGNVTAGAGLRFIQQAPATNWWDLGTSTNTDPNFVFSYRGGAQGYLNHGAGNSQLNFTGQHRTFIKDTPFTEAENLEGLIVSADQNKYIKMSGGIEAGSNAITVNESLPLVSLSVTTKDKKCFGVISTSEDPEKREEEYGNWVSVSEKEKGDTRVYINSVGEGAIWVTNINGPLESGDYITTSTVKGYGQKQDDDILHNYTVAKITMDCDFDPVTHPVQMIKKDEDEENILDEHDQIQWEDHPTETEKAYKIRYLDASGVETDEASAVHKAAFVGCTYHCG